MAVLILTGAGAGLAQTVEQQVAKIRAVYTETNRRITTGAHEDGSGFHHAEWTVGGDGDAQPWGIVGRRKQRTECWFDGEPDDEAAPKAQLEQTRKSIRKIVWTYEAAADIRQRSEFYFDENTGDLVFAHTTEQDPEGKPFERRFYYRRGKLIRMARDGKNFDGKIGAEDSRLAADALGLAKEMQDLLVKIIS